MIEKEREFVAEIENLQKNYLEKMKTSNTYV
jgi:hypothetical protein